MRVFISVELPDEIKKNVVELINELKTADAAVKWVEGKDLHITLKFLGQVEDGKMGDLMDISAKAVSGTGSFKARFEGIGTFPEGKNPRVVWAGVAEGSDKLSSLANRLEKNLSEAGFRKEERAFTSHLTIGRVKDKKGVDKLMEKIRGLKGSGLGETAIDRICIMKSTLTPKGPSYEIIKEVKI